MINTLVVLAWLLYGHYLADYAFQSDFMVRAKNRHTDLGKQCWGHVLSAHAGLHGGCVAVTFHIFGGLSWQVATLFGLIEFASHFLIDFGKCESLYSFHTDQMMHIACKLVWVAAALAFVQPFVS